MQTRDLTVRVHREPNQLWAEVEELPGCFASGETLAELWEALAEAVGLYLSDDGSRSPATIVSTSMVTSEVVEEHRVLLTA
jgi:predicted RNase H-like HicB family nuclease